MSLERVLQETYDEITRFVVFPSPAEPVFLTLWVAHTHAIDAAYATPYPYIHSPLPRCGKSTLLEVLASLVARPQSASNITAASMFRTVDANKPTLMLDEIDAQFGSDPERAGAMRSIINAGYRRGQNALVIRCDGPSNEPREFDTFGAKAFAGVEDPFRSILHETTRDRTMPVRLERKGPDDTIERWRPRKCEPALQALRDRLADQTAELVDQLADAEPQLPKGLNDRTEEVMDPLFAIAEAAGGAWPRRLAEATLALAAAREPDEEPDAVELLVHIQEVFEKLQSERVFSDVLCAELNHREERPWSSWNGRSRTPGLQASDLAKLLRPFRIRPQVVRVGSTTKRGYKREQFADPWARYVTPTAPTQPSPSPDDAVGTTSHGNPAAPGEAA